MQFWIFKENSYYAQNGEIGNFGAQIKIFELFFVSAH